MTRTIGNPAFSPKDPDEIVTLAFDFANLTSAPLAPVVTCARHSGADDAAPSAVLSGSPQISGAKILQQVQAGTHGTDYLMRCEVDTAEGQRYVIAGVMPVKTAGP